MEISVKGNTKNLSKKETKKIIKYLAEYLLGKRLSKYIYIEVKYQKMKDVYGLCDTIDYECPKHREFTLFIGKDMSRIQTIKTIIHEMVHVRQFARKHYDQSGNSFTWMGKRVNLDEDNYHRMPWEIEAVSYENPLYEECKELLR
jgi:hypothetical protein